MKFRFCGEADCPDWLLMQINTLSQLTPSQLQELCELVVQPLVGKELDYTKLRELGRSASLETTVVKACVSALSQILESGSCYGVSPNDLGRELEQLGLDRSHSQVIIRTYSEERGEVTARLREGALRVGRLSGLGVGPGPKLAFKHTDFAGLSSQQQVLLSPTQAQLLLNELKEVRSRMEELQAE